MIREEDSGQFGLPQLPFERVLFVDSKLSGYQFCAMLHWLVSSGRNAAVVVQCVVLNVALRVVRLSFTNGQTGIAVLGYKGKPVPFKF